MLFTTWGFVNLGSGKKQFTVLDRECAAIPYGTTFKLGRIEKMLASFPVGSLLVCKGNTGPVTQKVNVQNFSDSTFFRLKGITTVSNKFFVSVIGVDNQVVKNLRQMTDRFGSAALLRTAWFVVAETGKPYTLPVPLDESTARDYAVDVMLLSNARAVVVDAEGSIVSEIPYVKLEKEEAPKPVVEVEKKVTAVEKKPKKGNYFYFEEAPNVVLSAVAAKYRSGFEGCTNIMVTGESGTGKTTVARKFAEAMGWAYHRLNCALITEPSDIAGQRAIKNGETTWEWSAVATAMQNGNCVIILDELNRAYPNALNSLFGLLDDERKTWFNDLELKVGPNVVFIATVNHGSAYTGTFQADAALLNRFEYVFEMGDVPTKELVKILESNCEVSKETAQAIVSVSSLIKARLVDVPVSVRTLKAVASAVNTGFSVREAWQFVLVNRLPADSRRDLVDLLNNNISTMANTSIKLIF